MFKGGLFFTAVLLGTALTLTPYAAVSAQTSVVTDEQVQEQRVAIQYSMIRTAQEQFKMIQLLYIRHIESQIRILQNQVGSR